MKASVGHVRDLPKKIGVDLEKGLRARSTRSSRARRRSSPRSARPRARVETVYLATDPDREGEAIAWHIAEEIKDVNTNLRRVLFNEITKKGVTAAIDAPLEHRHEQDGRAAGAPHPRSPRRLRDQPDPVEQGPARPVGRPRAVGRRPPGVRARAKRSRRSSPRSTGRSTSRVAGPSRRRSRRASGKWKGEKAEPKTEDEADAIAAELDAGDAVVASRREEGAPQEAAGAVHHVAAAAGRRAQAALHRQAHDGARAAPLRRRRARRRGPDRPHHLHAYRLDAHLRRRDDGGARSTSPRRTAPSTCRESRTSTATRSARRTPTRRSARRSMEWTPEQVAERARGASRGHRAARSSTR